jgi:uncharacterized coiled-coil protein SlyX
MVPEIQNYLDRFRPTNESGLVKAMPVIKQAFQAVATEVVRSLPTENSETTVPAPDTTRPSDETAGKKRAWDFLEAMQTRQDEMAEMLEIVGSTVGKVEESVICLEEQMTGLLDRVGELDERLTKAVDSIEYHVRENARETKVAVQDEHKRLGKALGAQRHELDEIRGGLDRLMEAIQAMPKHNEAALEEIAERLDDKILQTINTQIRLIKQSEQKAEQKIETRRSIFGFGLSRAA